MWHFLFHSFFKILGLCINSDLEAFWTKTNSDVAFLGSQRIFVFGTNSGLWAISVKKKKTSKPCIEKKKASFSFPGTAAFPHFSMSPPGLTVADSMFLRSGRRAGAMQGHRCGERQAWSLQLEGDLDQMVTSLLQMYFTFPYPSLARSRSVTDRALSQQLWVRRWVAGVGGQWDLQRALIQPGR